MGSSGARVSSTCGTLHRHRQLSLPIRRRPAPPSGPRLLGLGRLSASFLTCVPVALLPRNSPALLSALPADPASAAPPSRPRLLGLWRLSASSLLCAPVALLRGTFRRRCQLSTRDPPPPPSALPADLASAGASFTASGHGAATPRRCMSPMHAGRSSLAEPSVAAVSCPCRSGVGRRLLPGLGSRGCSTPSLHV